MSELTVVEFDRSRRDVAGTIFDPELGDYESDPLRHQRILGLYVTHNVNPCQVQRGSVRLVRRGDGSVEVSFLATLPRALYRPGNYEDAHKMPFTEAIECHHGDEPHPAVIRDSFRATWEEVSWRCDANG